MEVPVYFFTGFLEAGKTSFIQESLGDEFFNDGTTTLLLVCEEGIEEYEPEEFATDNVHIEVVEKEKHLTKQWLKYLEQKYKVRRVLVEYNGMWELGSFINNLPDNWLFYQSVMMADATTFMNYNANMRNLVADKLKVCEMVVFNRFTDDMDKMEFHKIVRTFNKRSEILYEYGPDKIVQDDIEDPLPYDMDSDEIEVEDEDYAVWYRDVNEETPDYEGKTVHIKGRVMNEGKFPKGCFAFGRHVMTCCVEDIEFCAVVARMDDPKKLKNGGWINLTAKITEEAHKVYGGENGPVLDVIKAEPCEAPEDEVAVFY